MMAGIIFVISLFMLLQFFVSYCRSLIVSSRRHELSEQAREIAGVTAHSVRGDQFVRLLKLISLCPEPGGDKITVRAVAAYFNLLGLVDRLVRKTLPSTAQWIEAERGGCMYAAAVVLDRRIAHSRMLMTQQPLR
jgi:hypothetical protein